VSKLFEQRLKRLSDSGGGATLKDGLKGIEKESLRVTPEGYLSQRPHPRALGSPLTNRFITTDFSEALLEFVTPAVPETWQALRDLCDIHQFCYRHLDDELLWVTSMPCRIPEDPAIPLARYGSSNVGRMKTIYRNGLGYRYGRAMQTIAGLHFNYSVPKAFWDGWQELGGDRDEPEEGILGRVGDQGQAREERQEQEPEADRLAGHPGREPRGEPVPLAAPCPPAPAAAPGAGLSHDGRSGRPQGARGTRPRGTRPRGTRDGRGVQGLRSRRPAPPGARPAPPARRARPWGARRAGRARRRSPPARPAEPAEPTVPTEPTEPARSRPSHPRDGDAWRVP